MQKNQVTLSGVVEKDIFFELSEREQEILKLLVNGLRYKEIGEKYLSAPTRLKNM